MAEAAYASCPANGQLKLLHAFYNNPYIGGVIETKGDNHSQLKAWKAEHGADTVESWRVVIHQR
ncbi:hypothetical protein D3C80_1905190 [compost metagenome]